MARKPTGDAKTAGATSGKGAPTGQRPATGKTAGKGVATPHAKQAAKSPAAPPKPKTAAPVAKRTAAAPPARTAKPASAAKAAPVAKPAKTAKAAPAKTAPAARKKPVAKSPSPRETVAATKARPAPSPAPATPQQPATAEPRTATADKPETGGFAVPSPFDFLNPEQRQSLDALARNLTRASLTTQSALAQAGLQGATGAPSADPFHVGTAMTEVAGKLAAQPERLMQAQAQLFERYLDLWSNTAKRMTGQEAAPVIEPAKNDKRFKDEVWTQNPVFDAIKQSYLLTAGWLNDMVGGVDDVDPMTKRRVEFFTKMLTDAFAPTNFLLSNPAALRQLVETQGESLVKGAEQFAADLERGGGQLSISQTAQDRFVVGENVATAPGKVVFQNALFQLLQFSPSTEKVYEIPLLIFPPWINKYYILDLRPENSMIRWLTEQGFTVFVVSWVNPAPALAGMTLTDYMHTGALTAVEQVLKQTGAKTASTVGYCIGGTLLACTLAYMAATGDKRISAATFFAAQQDFTEAGDLLLFTNDDWLSDLEKRMDQAGGVLPSQSMADTFNALRANDLIWSFFVSNYLMGKEPTPFDLLFWNSDQTRMPKALHMGYLRDFYKSNRLAKGELVVDGVKLDLGAVKTPVYVQSSREDHIAPMRSVYRGARLFGGPTTFTLAGSGHIAGVINAPVAKKYQYWTNAALPDAVEAWQAAALEHAGSWWPHWASWLASWSGAKVDARDPAAGPLKPLEDAPGSYVKVRSDAAPAG